jgi:hypothetical protein
MACSDSAISFARHDTTMVWPALLALQTDWYHIVSLVILRLPFMRRITISMWRWTVKCCTHYSSNRVLEHVRTIPPITKSQHDLPVELIPAHVAHVSHIYT